MHAEQWERRYEPCGERNQALNMPRVVRDARFCDDSGLSAPQSAHGKQVPMAETIDWPPPSRRPRRLLLTLVLLVVLFFAAQAALSYFVDGLWFGSLGYESVFRRMLGLRWGVFAAFGAASFGLLYGSFAVLRRVHGTELPMRRAIMINGQSLSFSVERWLRPVALLLSLFVAFLTGTGMSDEWPVFERFLYAPRVPGGVADPIFGKALTFYLLRLPALELVSDWLLLLSVLCLIMAGLFLLLTGREAGVDRGRVFASSPARGRGISFALALLLLVFALKVYLGRFDLLFDDHTVFSGVSYVDAHVLLPGMFLTCLALLLGAGLALFGAVRQRGLRWLFLAVLPGLGCFLVFQVIGWVVSTFIVKPNELVKEQPFISNNIQFTRQAYGLDKIELRPFSAQTTLAAVDAAGNQATLENIRLWDWHALQDTLRQIQEIRTYYDFPDIDIDRYELNGVPHEVMLAARELSPEKLPESSQNWINEKLIYTHGYGVTMNPVNGFTPEGLPTLILSNMPVQSTTAGITLTRPEIYFGELTNSDVYVKTRQQEFNYPQGQTNSFVSYQGTGGVVLGGFLRRVLIALERGDLGKLPFSDDINPESRLLMRRNIRERVQTLAPFLTLESDPYIVVRDDGRLSWIIDAYTTSETYPYSRPSAFTDNAINYARNSVKAVVDAYDGTTTFYVFDPQDPVLAAYRNTFPGLFQDASAMPATLRKHIRYPEGLLKLQAQAYGLYHMTNPEMFYNREDLWTPATESGVDENGERTAQPMEPNFVLMKLPGETGTEFVNILPFTPANRNNLIGWIAGRSDGEHYGSALVYSFPKTRLIDGPLQVEARIDQNAQLSGQLTLWNQQGSHVRRGNLLVIPTGSALLYSESIYLQANQSPMPELRLVVLATQDRLAYGTTFDAAMAGLFGGAASSTSAAPATPEASPSPEVPATAAGASAGTDRGALIRQAAQELSDYERLTAEGKLGDAGKKLEDLKRILDQLNAPPR